MRIGGLILSGGKSRRMGGKQKGNLIYQSHTFVERLASELKKETDRIWLSWGKNIGDSCAGCENLTDIYPDCGPIGGIYTGLVKSGCDLLMAAACDMPLLRIELYRYLLEVLKQKEQENTICYKAVIPVTDGRMHPLAALYKASMSTVLERSIQRGTYRVRDAFQNEPVLYVDLSGQEIYRTMLRNVNTLEEYEDLLAEEQTME